MPERSLLNFFRAHAPDHPWLTVGPGQDCAVLDWPADRAVVFKTDQVVEGVHFALAGPGAATARQVGWKAVAKTVSDAAAAGCVPVAALVALAVPGERDEAFVKELYAGLTDCCRRFSFALAGGDLSASPRGLSLAVALLAAVPEEAPVAGGTNDAPTTPKDDAGKKAPSSRRPWTRIGGRPGDVLFVTGELGGAWKGKHLSFTPRTAAAVALRALSGDKLHACIDLSDGLARDLRHLCRESGCGAELEAARLPASAAVREDFPPEASPATNEALLRRVLGDGEDYELLFAVEPAAAELLERRWSEETPATRVGTLRKKEAGLSLLGPDGTRKPLPDVGYEHLRDK